MKPVLFSCAVFAASVLTVASLVSGLSAQNNAGRPDKNTPCIGCSVDGKTTPRTADGHPDLSGLWGANEAGHLSSRSSDGSVLFDFGGGSLGPDGKPFPSTPIGEGRYKENPEGVFLGDNPENYTKLSQPPYKPEYMAKVRAAVDKYQYGSSQADDPLFNCTPYGVPRSGGTMQILQTPQAIAILYESSPGPIYRLIYTDGRPHPDPDDLDASYLGDSIGHWEGDTLVVDVVGLNDETWLGGGFGGPKYGRQHSDQEHVVERWTRNGDVMTYEATVEDPVMFAKPWVITPRRMRHAGEGSRLLDAPCVPNDAGHIIKPTADDKYRCDFGQACAGPVKTH